MIGPNLFPSLFLVCFTFKPIKHQPYRLALFQVFFFFVTSVPVDPLPLFRSLSRCNVFLTLNLFLPLTALIVIATPPFNRHIHKLAPQTYFPQVLLLTFILSPSHVHSITDLGSTSHSHRILLLLSFINRDLSHSLSCLHYLLHQFPILHCVPFLLSPSSVTFSIRNFSLFRSLVRSLLT